VVVLVLLNVVLGGLLTMGIRGVSSVRHDQSSLRPIPGGTLTTGTVVDSYKHCFRGCSWQPRVEYTDGAGNVHTFTALYQDEYPAVGSTVPVSYNPWDPLQVHDLARGPSSLNFPLYTAFFVIGLCGLAYLGFGILAVSLWRKRGNLGGAPEVAGTGGPVSVDGAGAAAPVIWSQRPGARFVGQAWGFFLGEAVSGAFAVVLGVTHAGGHTFRRATLLGHRARHRTSGDCSDDARR
jgi:hypothetical protein